MSLTTKIRPDQIFIPEGCKVQIGDPDRDMKIVRGIVAFCKRQKNWVPITPDQLRSECGRACDASNLVNGGWIVSDGGSFHVTDKFVEQCLKDTTAD